MKFVLFMLSSFSLCFAEIREVYDFKEIYQELEKADFIIFDVDEVLITSEDLFFHPSLESYMLHLVGQEMSLAKGIKEKQKLEEKLSLSLLGAKKILVEPKIPKVLKQLKAKKKKAIALTHFPTGKFGKIDLLETFKIKILSHIP